MDADAAVEEVGALVDEVAGSAFDRYAGVAANGVALGIVSGYLRERLERLSSPTTSCE